MEENRPCPNCNWPIKEEMNFCPNCGQENAPILISAKSIFLDLMSSFFSFDSKFVKTVPVLMFKPGELTNQFVSGHRVAFLSPFRIYLFTSIVLFFIISLVFNENKILQVSDADLNEIHADSLTSDTLGGKFFTIGLNQKENSRSNNDIGGDNADDLSPWFKADSMIQQGVSLKQAVNENFSNQTKFKKFVIGQILKLKQENGRGFLNELMDMLSYSLFLFLPLFALLLKMIYLRSGRFYIEHVVFSLHYMSFVFIIWIIVILLDVVFSGSWMWLLLLLSILYLFVALKKVYRQSRGKTIAKFIILGMSTIGIFVPVLALITFIFSLIFY